MDLGEISTTKQFTDHKLFFQVEQDDKPFHVLDPILPLFHIIEIEVDRLALGHYDEAIHVFWRRVFEIMLLETAIFDLEYTSLFSVIFALKY